MKPSKKHTARKPPKEIINFELGVVYDTVATVLAAITGVRWGSVKVPGVTGIHHLACYELPIIASIPRKEPLADLQNNVRYISIPPRLPTETNTEWVEFLRDDLYTRIIASLEDANDIDGQSSNLDHVGNAILENIKSKQIPAAQSWHLQCARLASHWNVKNVNMSAEIREWIKSGKSDDSSRDHVRNDDNIAFWDNAEVIPAHVWL